MKQGQIKIGIEEFLERRVGELLDVDGCTKRTAVRLAIDEAIDRGIAPDGSALPPETALARIAGVSLGTVQAALAELVHNGAIIRRRGDGTRVRSVKDASDHAWHFRFLDVDGRTRLKFTVTDIAMERTFDAGVYTPFLGHDPAGYVRIRRTIRMSNGLRVLAEMVLPHAMAPRLVARPPIELLNVNIRTILERDFGLKFVRAVHRVEVIDTEAAQHVGYASAGGEPVFDIRARVFGPGDVPAYHQRILCSTRDCRLEF